METGREYYTGLAAPAAVSTPRASDPKESPISVPGHAAATRVYRAVRVRLTAGQVLLRRWRLRPPAAADVSRAVGWGLAVLVTRGPRAFLQRLNARTHALVREEYAEWVRLFDTPDDHEIQQMHGALARLSRRPRFSVLMPVYDTDERWLRAAIDSVVAQVYPDWELCIADDHSTDPRVGAVLRDSLSRDPRIRVVFRPVNGHIAAAGNSALAIASGDFLVLLDHDDVLPAHALLAVALELERHPDADLVYSDEDKIDEHGRRFDPYFKPDWNPELLLGQNMISHLGVYRAALVRALGGFRTGFEGSQDHDLALRVIERTTPGRIRHIPHVLYHWRAIAGSTARAADEKVYARRAARRAVQEHLDRTGVAAVVEPAPGLPGYLRPRYVLPEPPPHVTIVVPTRDRADLLAQCLDSVLTRTRYGAFDVVIVDNGSTAPDALAYLERIRHDARVTVLRVDEPFNFSRLNNLAAARARGALLCFLNNDTEVITPAWLEEMAAIAVRPEVGAVGARLLYPDGTVQHGGVVLGLGGIASHAHLGLGRDEGGHFGRARLVQAVTAVTAACLMIRRDRFGEAGGFDERLAVAYNDVDLCLRLRARGYRNVWTPFAELYHHESVSRGPDTQGAAHARFLEEAARMRERWPEVIAADPYHNPNLSLRHPRNDGLAFPPRAARPWRR